MKTARKWLAFMLAAGLMLSATTVFAAGRPNVESDGLYMAEDGDSGGFATIVGDQYRFQGKKKPISSALKEGDWWRASASDEWLEWDGSAWVKPGSQSKTSDGPRHKSEAEKEAEREAEARRVEEEKERRIQEQASREAVLLEGEAQDEGFENGAQMQAAREENKSAGEFYNNAVLNTPGVENAVPVAQGGNLIVDGQTTNMTANISKVTNRAYADSVRNAQTGTVLNVVEVTYPAVEATVNFYMPGITGAENIVALQYNAGAWVNVEVAEVRADHVTLNMTGNGVVAFIAQ